jgi:hypothetical protein
VTVGRQNIEVDFTPQGTSGGTTNLPTQLNQVAQAITHSTERYTSLVEQAYQTYLKRTPDAVGLPYWIGQLQTGTSITALEASLTSSAEYMARQGKTKGSWITGLYRDILGRLPSVSEVNGWLNALAQGATAVQVAQQFLTSTERATSQVQADYQTYLGRPADATGLGSLVSALQHGKTNEDLVIALTSSMEYYNGRGKGDPATWVRSLYNDILHRSPSSAEVQNWVNHL